MHFVFHMFTEEPFSLGQVSCLSNTANLTSGLSHSGIRIYPINTHRQFFRKINTRFSIFFYAHFRRYPPKVPSLKFNDHSKLSDEEKKILPRRYKKNLVSKYVICSNMLKKFILRIKQLVCVKVVIPCL